MRQTPNLSLKLPDLTDYVNVEDFNENFTAIDEEIGKIIDPTIGVEAKLTERLNEKSTIASGSYTGNSASTRTITVGFTPKFLFVSGLNEPNNLNSSVAFITGYDATANSMGDNDPEASNFSILAYEHVSGMHLTTNGFIVKNFATTNRGMNLTGKTYGWVAIG